MDRIRILATLLLACVAALTSGKAAAQARGAKVKDLRAELVDPVVERAAMLTELDNWLRRLPGRYRLIEFNAGGLSEVDVFRKSKSIMDCVGIGSGAGVNCMNGGIPFQGGPREFAGTDLYGVDPDQGVVRILTVGSNSIAETRIGKLDRGVMRFSGTCPKSINSGTITISCDREIRTNIMPNGNLEIRVVTRQRVVPPSQTAGHRSSHLLEIVAIMKWERVPAGEDVEKPRAR